MGQSENCETSNAGTPLNSSSSLSLSLSDPSSLLLSNKIVRGMERGVGLDLRHAEIGVGLRGRGGIRLGWDLEEGSWAVGSG